MNTITFPNLNLEFNIDPVAFRIGEKPIYWYGIIIMSGIVIALIMAYFRIKKMPEVDRLSKKISWDTVIDLVLWMLPIGIICARLYFCIFKWDYYSANPMEIFKIWNGGLAIYGGIIGGVVTGIIFCKIKKINFFELADFFIPYLPFCQAVGRWGNFVNREAFGEQTDTFFKMGLYSETGKMEYYHPAFLYESVCNFIIFFILLKLYKNKKFSGQIFCLYFILYGIARFFIEGIRTDSLYIGNTDIRVSQALSLVLVVVFGIIYIVKRILYSKGFLKKTK